VEERDYLAPGQGEGEAQYGHGESDRALVLVIFDVKLYRPGKTGGRAKGGGGD